MKVIIQIPCLNEQEALPTTMKDIPRTLVGVDQVEILIVNDGSTDRTSEVAKACGAHHVLELNRRRGLAQAFAAGLRESIRLGADIIVNTDADNQYCGADIQKLVDPILEKSADMVIGARPIDSIHDFSKTKKVFQKIGSWVVRQVSNVEVRDAASGFRAFSRETALKVHVYGQYTYTLETIIQASRSGVAITSVPIRTNPMLRPSRLVRSSFDYIYRSALTIARVYVTYNPLRAFITAAGFALLGSLFLGMRYLWLIQTGEGRGHVQSIILCGTLAILGFLLGVAGMIAELISINRRLLEKIDFKISKMDVS